MRVKWSEEQDKILSEMWLAGVHAELIASRLNISVAAVRNKAGAKAKFDARYKRFAPRSVDSHRRLILGSNLVPEDGMCGWIFGEGAQRRLCSCVAASGRPYCKAHCEIAYEPMIQE